MIDTPVAAKASPFRSSDFIGGIFLIVLAAVVYSQARGLEREALMGIGPGYFPFAFAALLAVLGLTLLGSAWLTQSEPVKLTPILGEIVTMQRIGVTPK